MDGMIDSLAMNRAMLMIREDSNRTAASLYTKYKYCEFSEEERSNPNYLLVRSIIKRKVPKWTCRTNLNRLTIEELRYRFMYGMMGQKPDDDHVPIFDQWLERDGVVLIKCRDSQSQYYLRRCLWHYHEKYLDHRPRIEVVDVGSHYVAPCDRTYLGYFALGGVPDHLNMRVLKDLSTENPEVMQWQIVQKNTLPAQPGLFGPVDLWYFDVPGPAAFSLRQRDFKLNFKGRKLHVWLHQFKQT
ncbi:unnamed protein product [Trichogramma brassicae]|uniref:DUF4780 domain-containing protein n=1 Tax=Trichogramma brassicae TaxID=86971 RepID=A0A6H5IVI4_9HYME|nr:unnamed protein product [Trichogramma brassicae]